MLCEKCKEKEVTVHITQNIRAGASTGEAPETATARHFCDACGREFMQSADFQGASFSKAVPRIELFAQPCPNPNPPPPEPQIDTSKRYDVYCFDADRQAVVYRNALFKGSATLLPHPGGRVHFPDYIELEQANGQSIFLPRSSIFRFCLPGTTFVGEAVVTNKPSSH
jgi:hypothetical protein